MVVPGATTCVMGTDMSRPSKGGTCTFPPHLSDEEKRSALRDAFKGKRVLLALDDLWEEEHAGHLNFVDGSSGSRVLISTRIRHLLSDCFAVEIDKPSLDDSIKILMAAAELPRTESAPSEAREIVDLCGRLPLALVMAGKLILELDVGTEWEGITSILREELRGNEQASSREQGVIRASLAGMKGSERDKTGARTNRRMTLESRFSPLAHPPPSPSPHDVTKSRMNE